MATYEPGQCNIGPREQRKRRLLGIASLIGGVAYVVAVVAVAWPPEALLATFVFAAVGTLGLLQSREQFSISHAMTERYDLTAAGGDAGQVRNAAAVRADRLRAGRLVAKALAIALVVTIVLYVVGVVAI